MDERVASERERNNINNANNVRNAAKIAAATGHPVAAGIGKGVQVADKLSGGKASERLGKALTRANKMSGLRGRTIQKGLNKLSESGTSEKIGKSASKVGGSMSSKGKTTTNAGIGLNGGLSNNLETRETQEKMSDEGSFNFKVDFKVLYIGLITMVPVMTVIIFCCLLMSSSLLIQHSIGVGNADTMKNSEVEGKIKSKGLETEDKSNDSEAFDYDYFIDENVTKFRNSKLKQVKTSKSRLYNEADIEELEDYYSDIANYTDTCDPDAEDPCDIDVVYTFFFKLFYLYSYYNDKYHVDLDLPLLMSTLTVQNNNMNNVFKQNIKGYGKSQVKLKDNNDRFNYNKTFNYLSTSESSEFDIEILAQHMVVSEPYVESEKNCDNPVDGSCYSIDTNSYDNFLSEFLEKKYYLSEYNSNSWSPANNTVDYQFVEQENKELVYNLITEIYDSKEQYEDLVGDYEETEIVIYEATSNSYWWPIGSSETTEVNGKLFANGNPETVTITSNFGYRKDPLGRGIKFHSGLDISGPNALGRINIIAARDGVVVKTNTNCTSGRGLDGCGGGYGNHIIIQHSDGNYTLYAHLYENSITVSPGESVRQGQLIAKMGSSGNSTGAHLHFEVREGANDYNSTVDPLNYISADNPRIVATGGEFLSWLNSWEGHSPIEGDYYIVEDIGDGVRTVGGGVTLEHNADSFAKYGINIADYPVGSRIAISIVDQIQLEEVASKRSYIENVLSNNSITLKETEIQALVSQMYNCGNINGFVNAYKNYGNTQEFYDNWFFRAIMVGSEFENGLRRRRNSEWSLFHESIYVYNK